MGKLLAGRLTETEEWRRIDKALNEMESQVKSNRHNTLEEYRYDEGQLDMIAIFRKLPDKVCEDNDPKVGK